MSFSQIALGISEALWLQHVPHELRRQRLTQLISEFSALRVRLVAPYCAIPRDYLSDTPLLRAMGLLVSQHDQLGAIPPPPFLSISPLESM